MKRIAIIGAALASLTACGGAPEQEAAKEPKAAAEKPEVKVDPQFIKEAGRWETEVGSVSEEGKLIIDLASDGSFTIDVRAPAANDDLAVVEMASGKAQANGTTITGRIEGEVRPGILSDYKEWEISGEGEKRQLSGSGERSIAILKTRY